MKEQRKAHKPGKVDIMFLRPYNRGVYQYVCQQQPFSAPSRKTLANEIPKESSYAGEGRDCVRKAV